MEKIFNIILILLISLNGVFFYKGYFDTPFRFSQYAFFIFSVGVLGSYLLYKKNRWIGLLGLVAIFGFFRSYALQQVYSIETLFQEFIGGVFIFLLYYITRELNIKEDKLKWFLIPASLNIFLILIQKFDGNALNFMLVTPEVTGFLGNVSLSSCFFALTTPIFLRYIPYSFFPLFIVSVLCESRMPLLALIVSSLVYWNYANKKLYRLALFVFCLITAILIIDIVYVGNLNNFYVSKKLTIGFCFRERGAMQVGTIDGAMKNPILGWGIGSMIPIMSRITEKESQYCGGYFNTKDYKTGKDPAIIMNHPHNEYLYGWWNFGIMWLIGLFLLMKDIDKKFKINNILPFSILIGCMVLALGYYFTYPVWMLVGLTLGIYHNQTQEA